MLVATLMKRQFYYETFCKCFSKLFKGCVNDIIECNVTILFEGQMKGRLFNGSDAVYKEITKQKIYLVVTGFTNLPYSSYGRRSF